MCQVIGIVDREVLRLGTDISCFQRADLADLLLDLCVPLERRGGLPFHILEAESSYGKWAGGKLGSAVKRILSGYLRTIRLQGDTCDVQALVAGILRETGGP